MHAIPPINAAAHVTRILSPIIQNLSVSPPIPHPVSLIGSSAASPRHLQGVRFLSASVPLHRKRPTRTVPHWGEMRSVASTPPLRRSGLEFRVCGIVFNNPRHFPWVAMPQHLDCRDLPQTCLCFLPEPSSIRALSAPPFQVFTHTGAIHIHNLSREILCRPCALSLTIRAAERSCANIGRWRRTSRGFVGVSCVRARYSLFCYTAPPALERGSIIGKIRQLADGLCSLSLSCALSPAITSYTLPGRSGRVPLQMEPCNAHAQDPTFVATMRGFTIA
ncbi:hypothetical protein C8R45DRAFT_473298 [Mycena sanguinolenta]|nr:hypothetical protein C8R45DRAFT_473298 [Mycena sanguinolenta]